MIIAAITAMPPTTPPAMAPVGVEWPGVGVAEVVVGLVGSIVVVVCDWIVDDGEVELGLDVGDEAYTGIDCVRATKVALGFPPSVATANSVFIVGESSQYQFDAVTVPVASTSRNWLQYGEVGLLSRTQLIYIAPS